MFHWKRWLSEHLLTKMNFSNPSISASSYDQAGWGPAVTLSVPEQKTNFFPAPGNARCTLMRGRRLRMSGWVELFASFSNYTFLKFTIMAAFLSVISVSLLPMPHLLFFISCQLVTWLMGAAWIPWAAERCRNTEKKGEASSFTQNSLIISDQR